MHAFSRVFFLKPCRLDLTWQNFSYMSLFLSTKNWTCILSQLSCSLVYVSVVNIAFTQTRTTYLFAIFLDLGFIKFLHTHCRINSCLEISSINIVVLSPKTSIIAFKRHKLKPPSRPTSRIFCQGMVMNKFVGFQKVMNMFHCFIWEMIIMIMF